MSAVLNRAVLLATMARKGWNQSDLAKAANMKQPTISRLLSGAAEPSSDTIGKLLLATGLRYDQLFNEDTKAPDRLYTTAEVADRFGLTPAYITRLVQRGELHAIRMGTSTRAPRRFSETELARFLSQQEAS